MTRSKKKQFDEPSNLSIFATKDTQATQHTQHTQGTHKAKANVKPKKNIAKRHNTSKKTVNHSPKQTKRAAELRSQRKQILLTPTTAQNVHLVATMKNTSDNDIINKAVEAYIKKEFRHNPEEKTLASKLLKVQHK